MYSYYVVICSSETGLPLSEVIFIVDNDYNEIPSHWHGYEPSEFVAYVLEMYKQSDFLKGKVCGGNFKEAKNFLHDCAVRVLLSTTPPSNEDNAEEIRAGHIVKVLTESSGGDRQELFFSYGR